MDFFDNVVNKSNAIIKDRLNNPFGTKQATSSQDGADQPKQQVSQDGDTTSPTTTTTAAPNSENQAAAAASVTDPTNQDADEQDSIKNGNNSQFAAIAADAEAVAQKAAQGAKTFGTFLFSMANKAGQHVSQTAKQVKQAVESTSILTDFTREQQEFIKEHGGSLQAGDLPWANCNDENKSAELREQILSLSQDKRNFVRSPPNDANFMFDAQTSYPVALSLLREDQNLNKMRYELVPKLVNEDTFWRNYFYRVSVLQQLIEKGESVKKGWSSSRSSSGEGPDEDAGASEEPLGNQQQETDQTILEDYQTEELESSESMKLVAEADDLKSKLRELNIGSLDEQDDDKWEEELQRDLQEFELVSGGDVSALDEEALDSEIMELKQAGQKALKRK